MNDVGPPSHRAGRHAHRGRRPARPDGRGGTAGLIGLAALALVAVGGAGVAGGAMLGGSGTAPAPVASAGPPAPPPAVSDALADAALGAKPTMIGRVTAVSAGDEVTAEVAGRSMPIRVLGIAAPAVAGPGRAAECGGAAALEHARTMMAGQMVTLVPDPTQPEFDDRGRRLAYVVLRSQLSYTDAALTAGVSRADTTRPLWYSDVFTREQDVAARAGRGIWGAPCRLTP